MKTNYFTIPFFILLLAILGGMIVSDGLVWYALIAKPTWTPPSLVFSSAWIVIYILSGYSLLIVWNRFKRDRRFNAIMGLWLINAALYLAYVYLFFTLHLALLATLCAAVLVLDVIAISVLIWKKSKRAALVLLPYAFWALFATYLTYAVWHMNQFDAITRLTSK